MATSESSPTAKRVAWRSIAFTIVTGLAALVFMGLFGGATTILDPWITTLYPASPGYTPAIHRWHQAQWAAQMGILLGGALVALLWRPRAKPVLAQFLILGILIFELFTAPFGLSQLGPFVLAPLMIISLVIAAYPDKRALLETTREGPISRPLLALGLLALVLLTPVSWQAWQLQFGAADEHVAHHHWASAVVVAGLLALATLLAATKRPGWQTLGVLAGAAFLYLGAAALTEPGQAGSWGMMGGVLSAAGGSASIIITLQEAKAHR